MTGGVKFLIQIHISIGSVPKL